MREITYRDIVKGLRALGMDGRGAALAHASLSAFGRVAGGADAVVGALMNTCDTLLMPAFTYETMVVPPAGAPGNAMDYGSGGERNAEARFFSPDTAASPGIGVIPETLRQLAGTRRSTHPVLSFAGVNADEALAAQTLEAPLGPVEWLERHGGDVLLLGVDHTANTSIHLSEQRAGRKRFVRWALTRVEADGTIPPSGPSNGTRPLTRWSSVPAGIVACPNFPGCSDGFGSIASRLAGVARETSIGPAVVTRVPVADLLRVAEAWLRDDPLALLCTRPGCERCAAVRRAVGSG